MAIREAKTIAEYAIRKWMESEGFVLECFRIKFSGHEAIISDGNGDALRLIYDTASRTVIPVEIGEKEIL